MKIKTFYVVLKPTKNSTIDDICYPCNFKDLILQSKGGLDSDDIFGVYDDPNEAIEIAETLLSKS